MRKLKKAAVLSVLLLLALVICYPIWFAFTGAFSSQWELEENLSPLFSNGTEMVKWSLLPQAPTLQSLVEVLLDSPGFFPMFWNSVAIAAGILLGQLLLALPASWALARFPIAGKKTIMTLYENWMNSVGLFPEGAAFSIQNGDTLRWDASAPQDISVGKEDFQKGSILIQLHESGAPVNFFYQVTWNRYVATEKLISQTQALEQVQKGNFEQYVPFQP